MPVSFRSTFTAAALSVLLTLLNPCAQDGVDAASPTLDIYFIDVEGGQATLVVTPQGESLLVDTGFPGSGTFQSQPVDPGNARDAGRILAAARAAGVRRIDYLLITHFHADHAGGVVELAQQLPIATFVDHDSVPPDAESNVPGTLAMFARYEAVRRRGRHLDVRAGDRLPLKGMDAVVVSSAGTAMGAASSLAGRQKTNGCDVPPIAAQEAVENPRSTGIRLQFGRFRFLDVGDLTGPPLHALACPVNVVGRVDVYLVSHHGGADAADPATLAAFHPRAAIVNNGATKGGAADMFAALHKAREAGDIGDVWQLHRSENRGADNFSDDRIANLDETTAHWIKVSASRDGSFRVTNGRTNAIASFPASRP